MPAGLIGRKLGMTRIFGDDGSVVPVSVIEATPNTITRLRTAEQDGYVALQLGAGTAKRVTKPVAGPVQRAARRTCSARASCARCGSTDAGEYAAGQQIDVSLFAAGDLVDVTGTSKGKGFAGTIKRHHFQRGPKTPRLEQLPPAGLGRRRHHTRPGVQEHQDGGPPRR